ncbi:hypothetical protein IFM89_017455, partial [Coptis chinensis]
NEKLKEEFKKKVNTLEQELLLCKKENEKFNEELREKVNTLKQELLLCKEENGKLKEELKKNVNTHEQELLLCKEENEKFKEELKKKDHQEGDKEKVQPQTDKAVYHHVSNEDPEMVFNEDAEMVPNEFVEMVPNESLDFRGPSFSIGIPLSPIPKEKEKEQRNDREKEAEIEIKMTSKTRKVKNNRYRKTKQMDPNFTKEKKTKPLKKVINLDTGREIIDKGKQVRDIDSGPLLDPKTNPYYHGLEESHRQIIDTFFKMADTRWASYAHACKTISVNHHSGRGGTYHTFVDQYFTTDMWKRTYAEVWKGIHSREQWDIECDDECILPPEGKRQAGRSPTVRM